MENQPPVESTLRRSVRINRGQRPGHLNDFEVDDQYSTNNPDAESEMDLPVDSSPETSPSAAADQTIRKCTPVPPPGMEELAATIHALVREMASLKSHCTSAMADVAQTRAETSELKLLLSQQNVACGIPPATSVSVSITPTVTTTQISSSSRVAFENPTLSPTSATCSQASVPTFASLLHTATESQPPHHSLLPSAFTIPSNMPSSAMQTNPSTTKLSSVYAASASVLNIPSSRQPQLSSVLSLSPMPATQHPTNTNAIQLSAVASQVNQHAPLSSSIHVAESNSLALPSSIYQSQCQMSSHYPNPYSAPTTGNVHEQTDPLARSHQGTPSAGFDSRRILHDLPEFAGEPEKWPRFIAAFKESTLAFGYSNLENLFRLQKCLKGTASEVVDGLLIHHENVEAAVLELELHFGQPSELVKSQISKVKNFPQVTERNLELIIQMATKVRNLAAFLQTTQSYHHLANPTLLDELVGKLPRTRQLAWADYSDHIRPFPSVIDFSAWITHQARLVQRITPQAVVNSRDTTPRRRANVLQTSERRTNVCDYCSQSHSIGNCNLFKHLSVRDRWKVTKEKMLCIGCLKSGHNLRACRNKQSCNIHNCQRPHNPLLHESTNNTSVRSSSTDAATNAETNPEHFSGHCHPKSPGEVLFRILPIRLYGPIKQVDTFALLDEGSSVSLIDEGLATELGLKGKTSPLCLQWIGNKRSNHPSQSVDIEVSATEPHAQRFRATNVRTVKNMALPTQSLNMEQLSEIYSQLKPLNVASYRDAKPLLLIGLDNCHLGLPRRSGTQVEAGPIVVYTKLGPMIYGPYSSLSNPQHSYDTTLLVIDSELEAQMEDFLASENFGATKESAGTELIGHSRARTIMDECTVRKGEQFETALLWKTDNISLPDSFELAYNRLLGIERKMKKDPEYGEQYKFQISSYLNKGYVRKLTEEDREENHERIWYLPHFGVRNPNKPGKLRLVFDAAAKVEGISLNSQLLSGPDLNQTMMSVLANFRTGKIGVCADIREMFSQVRIRPEDCHVQSFIWRDNTAAPVEHFMMQVMTFGATCSPCLAQHVKNKNALEHSSDPNKARAVEAILYHHYVDDYVDSFSDVIKAIDTSKMVRDIHKGGGFELRGFISNSKEVVNALEDTPETSSKFTIYPESVRLVEKVLGLYWDTTDDNFKFEVNYSRIDENVANGQRVPTKRELLSLIMSVFDPLGMLADIMVGAKEMLREAWQSGTGWDQELPENVVHNWKAWLTELSATKYLRIARCHSIHLKTADEIQLHTLVDASECAFAAVCFFCIKHPSGVDISYVCGKSRSAPIKHLSIPRLELQAAVLGTRLSNSVIKNYNVSIARKFFWSDSRTVLSWIKSDIRRYTPYVAHRVAEIMENTSATDWRWIPTKLNVADDATRSKTTSPRHCQSRWTTGPQFLREEESEWPSQSSVEPSTKEEIRPKYLLLLLTSHVSRALIDVTKFSVYSRLKRTIGWVIRFANRCLHRTANSGELTVEELESAQSLLCRQAQNDMFAEEIAALNNDDKISKSSQIYQLNPFLDKQSNLRVHGRIDAADWLPYDSKYPVILPKGHPLTALIIMNYHKRMHHQNLNSIINEIRHKFWVVNTRSEVKRVCSKCQLCKVLKAKPRPPLMGQLPPDRKDVNE